MDQIVEVIGHFSPERVHYKVHLFFHHLHLYDDVGWSRNSDGWTAHVLSFQSARGVTTLWPVLIPSFSIGTFLVFLLGTYPHVPLP